MVEIQFQLSVGFCLKVGQYYAENLSCRCSHPYHANTQIGMTLLSLSCSVTVVAGLSFIQLFGWFKSLSDFDAWPKF